MSSPQNPDSGHDLVPAAPGTDGDAVEHSARPADPRLARSHYMGDYPLADVEHLHRRADTDVRAAKRAEHQVATMFALASLFFVLSVVAFFAISPDTMVSIPPFFGTVNGNHVAVGTCLGLGIFFIGAGAIHWAKKLMPDAEAIQMRHPLRSEDADRAAAVETFWDGAEDSGFAQRKIIRRSLIGAMALLPIPIIVLLRDLGGPDMSPDQLTHTIWHEGVRVVTDPAYGPIRADEIPVGGLVNAIPENLHEVQEAEGNLNARAKAAIILVRMSPEEIRSQQGENWDYQGILAFSKICTHVGCPISLYQQRTHHLLCPCHQSTFDLADSGRVVFGPAARDLPQLAITVDDEGYLVARGDFAQPVGPSFWERGN